MKIKCKLILLIITAIISMQALPVLAQEYQFNPTQVQGMELEARIEGSGEITGELQPGQEIELRLLSFSNTRQQEIIELREQLFIGEQIVNASSDTDEFGNHYAVFTLTELPENEFTYELYAKIRTNKHNALLDFDLANSISDYPEYNEATEYINSEASPIQTLVLSNFQENSAMQTIRDVTDWTYEYLDYDLSFGAAKTLKSTEILEAGKGVCDEYSNLSAAFFRAKGIPTRFVAGIVFSGITWDHHAWIQAWVPGSGWVDVDPTYLEAGVVDGTHVVMGVFDDYSNIVDTISYPSNIQINVETQNKFEPSAGSQEGFVNVIAQNGFPEFITITLDEKEINAKENEELIIKIKNNTDKFQIIPIEIFMHNDFEVQEDTKDLILLAPNQEKMFTWNIKANTELLPTQYANYEYKFSAPAGLLTGNIKVVKSLTSEEEGSLERIDLLGVVPVQKNGTLDISIELKNFSESKKPVVIEFEGIETFNESIEGKTIKTFTYSIPKNSHKEIIVNITGSQLNESKRIIIAEQPEVKEMPGNAEESEKENGMKEQINIPKVPESLNELVNFPFIIAGAVIAVLLLILVLKLAKIV